MNLSKVKNYVSNKYLAASLFFVSGLAAAEGGAAGVPDYAGQAMDSLLTQANAMIGKVWPVVVTIVTAGLLIRMFRKFSSKAV